MVLQPPWAPAYPPTHFPLPPRTRKNRYQRSRQGDLREGDPVPPGLVLSTLTGGGPPVDLAVVAAGPRPVAILAGSWS